MLSGVREALQRLQRAGYLLFLVSNQPNYAKGKSSLAELDAIDAELRRLLADMCVEFAAFYYCLHHHDGDVAGYSGPCACRKPSPYFLLRAAREFGVDLAHSWMVGDRTTDILCGLIAGARTIFIGAGGADCGQVMADRVAADLAAAAKYICEAAAECLPELQVESL
jgi:D-glycero-D-manno-heptose 1,7-bisphosphate phosphatase